MSEWPTRCAEVTYDMADRHKGEPTYEANVGSLLWDPKMGAGHVVVREAPCNGSTINCGCGGWGSEPCKSLVLICECGQDDSYRDHHDYILARRA